jgi:hypothetical protein
MRIPLCSFLRNRVLVLLSLFTFLLAFSGVEALGQATIATGAIQGTVTDQSDAVVPGAIVTIRNVATAQTIVRSTSSSGVYNSGPLNPGNYTVSVDAKGFSATNLPTVVTVGNISPGNVKLGVASEKQEVTVEANGVSINTEQATVQGVLTTQQIDNLPVDGRNFLNLAQLEPGVQLQDGQNFDPTKAGYSSVSFNGVNGRTARIELDGVDVSDETVGTTTLNISAGSIQEFQIARSSLDASTELTSSGAINVSTRSGTNTYHGEGFGLFRDRRAGFANSPGGLSTAFQRDQFGGSFGGAIIKDKLFFFANSERVKQSQAQPLTFSGPFASLSGGVNAPFRDTYSVGRLDYNAPKNVHLFYRFAFEENLLAANFGFGFSYFANRDNTPAHAIGADFVTGSFSHSIRFSYEKFHNLIGDLTGSGGFFNPLPGAFISVGDLGLQTGPNLLAPQQTYQANHQIKYDGSKVSGNHVFRYGVSFNKIDGGGFASFFGLGPEISTRFSTATSKGVTDLSNVLAYPIRFVEIGNGQGFFTEKAAFGAPAGGQQDNRISLYGGDSWKIFPSLTFSAALRYQRDTGRNDADLGSIPCSAIAATVVSTGLAPCTGSSPLFSSLLPGLGAPVRQPDTNFGPQVGFAWDVFKNGKTVVRGGAGIYYENSIFNNTLFDRPPKLAKGLFFNTAEVCGAFGNTINFPNADGTFTTMSTFNGQSIATLCGETIGQAGPSFIALEKAYQAAVKAAGPAANPSYVANTLEVAPGSGLALYSPNYQPTRSYQMNLGIQRELWGGGVLSADYIRNVGLHFPLTIDANHVGAARFLNKNAAVNAIATTTAGFNCAGGASSAAIDCAIANGAGLADFAGNGLDSGGTFLSGAPASLGGVTPDTGAAFAGMNPLFGQMLFQYYSGRSLYNALQVNYRQQIAHQLARGFIKGGNFEASYTLSRFESNGGNDQNFSAVAQDNDSPTKFFGPTALDRTHQLSFGGVLDLKYGPRVSLISHFYSAPPGTLAVEDSGDPGAIFRNDFTGDGTIGDLVPGTNIGSYGRSVSPSGLNGLINNYNSGVAGKLTPAGQALVSAGLFTQAQLVALGATAQPLLGGPSQPFGNGTLRTFDFRFSYPFKIGERFHIEPSVAFFNLFNFANFGNIVTTTPATSLALASDGSAASGSVQQATTSADRVALRLGNGSGTFAQGSPRETEFGLRITF